MRRNDAFCQPKILKDMQTIYYSANNADEGAAVLSILKQKMHISASMISRLKRETNGILLNGEKAYVTRTVHTGDMLLVCFPSENVEDTDSKCTAKGFSVLYEDEFILIINKEAGLSVQPVKDPDEITLETYLKEYLHCNARPHPVSRLDKGTSGIMTVAKNAYVHELLKRQMHSDAYYKEYRALVKGRPVEDRGRIEAPIGFYEGSTYARCVRADGAPSISLYEILSEKAGVSYVRLVPVTGRTHQLRVHMAYIGCALLGDWLYGERSELIDRPALHSCFLRIRHPITGAQLEVTCPIPSDMQKILYL